MSCIVPHFAAIITLHLSLAAITFPFSLLVLECRQDLVPAGILGHLLHHLHQVALVEAERRAKALLATFLTGAQQMRL